MVVGAAQVELRIHGAQSLKEKRGVVRSMVRRVQNRFNVAVAEVDGQDTWQRAVLGLAVVALDGGSARGVLERIFDFLEELHLAEVTGQEIELLALGAEPIWRGPEEEPA